MANSKSSATSILGIIAIILVIAAAAYYLVNEADDDELEIDIGVVSGGTAPHVVSSEPTTRAQPVFFFFEA